MAEPSAAGAAQPQHAIARPITAMAARGPDRNARRLIRIIMLSDFTAIS
ncbi:MAG TPA: hypothetical protein VMD75_09650 [Candidatus Binataceae bacterium]|nr:hypothetical protein [Candidatus Binataceae bacterium]